MNEKFFDLKKEKQDSILNAAMRVFALSGYDKASTDEMVKRAGISKGLLFHYFGSKSGLYVFLYGYASKYMLMELSSGVSRDERNYFTVRSQVEKACCMAMMNFPYIQLFLARALRDEVCELEEELKQQKEELLTAYNTVYSSVDYSGSGIADPAILCAMVEYSLKGIMDEAALEPYFSVEAYRNKALAFIEAYNRLCNP